MFLLECIILVLAVIILGNFMFPGFNLHTCLDSSIPQQ